MTRITIDPNELASVASGMRGVALETAEVGTALRRCAECAMPPEVESVVARIISTSDAILDEMARRLLVSANDLVARAVVVAQDSLSTMSAAAGGSSIGWRSAGDIGGFGGSPSTTDSDAWGSGDIGGFGDSPAASESIVWGSGDIGGFGGTPASSQVGESWEDFKRRTYMPPAPQVGPTWNEWKFMSEQLTGRSMDDILANSSPVVSALNAGINDSNGRMAGNWAGISRDQLSAMRGYPVSLEEYRSLGLGGSESLGFP